MLLHELGGAAEILRRVHGQPHAGVAVAAQLALGGELGERRELVVAALGEPLERLLAEDVDAGVDPLVEHRRFAKAGDRAVLLEIDDAEGGTHLGYDDRRGRAALLVLGDEAGIVEVEQLVSVEREHRAALPAMRRGKAEAAAAAERLALPHRLDLGAEADERVPEDVLLAGAAGDDDARHSRVDESADGVLGERKARDGDERLRQPRRRLAQPLRLPACEEKSLHQARAATAVAFVGRPIASYSKPAATTAAA